MLTPPTLRNKWFKDHDGVLTRPVDPEDTVLERIDLDGQYQPPNGYSAGLAYAYFENVTGLTLSTPTIEELVVLFSSVGEGSVDLCVNFYKILGAPEEVLEVGDGVQAVAVNTVAPGTVIPAGNAVQLEFSSEGVPGEHAGYVLRLTKGADSCLLGPLVDTGFPGTLYGNEEYQATLLEDLPASMAGAMGDVRAVTDWVRLDGVNPRIATEKLRFPLRFIDPRNPSQDDYT